MAEEQVLAFPFHGKRYDCGSKLGYLEGHHRLRPRIRKSAAFAEYLRA
jgi:UTP--glucose-1-phosphate uridylyltransferase